MHNTYISPYSHTHTYFTSVDFLLCGYLHNTYDGVSCLIIMLHIHRGVVLLTTISYPIIFNIYMCGRIAIHCHNSSAQARTLARAEGEGVCSILDASMLLCILVSIFIICIMVGFSWRRFFCSQSWGQYTLLSFLRLCYNVYVYMLCTLNITIYRQYSNMSYESLSMALF